MQFESVPIDAIRPNPHNPRSISAVKFNQLVESIRAFPEMLFARPIVVDSELVVIGGNMRWRAAKQAGLMEVPIYIAPWSAEKTREFLIKDNVSFGEWDWDLIANDWDEVEIAEWGLDVWQPAEEPEEETEPETCAQCGRKL